MSQNKQLLELLDLANNYPSPHNGQPMHVKANGTNKLELYFTTSRGLTAAPISHLFSFVTIGVFVGHLEYCAKALGHRLEIDLALPPIVAMAGPDELKCAAITVTYNSDSPSPVTEKIIKTRQTSRKKYESGLSKQQQDIIVDLARQQSIDCRFVKAHQAQQVVWLNQRAVFDDMFDPAVRQELDHWLRYDAAEKHAKQDGLSYDCMELSGAALHFAVRHYKILHWPIVASVLQKYYVRTMRDDSTVGYFLTPFETATQAYAIGRAIIDVWLELTKHGQYLHPFGTIVSNDQAHHDFCELIGLGNESRSTNYVTFIFRAGHSQKPVESDRLPIAKQLYNQA